MTTRIRIGNLNVEVLLKDIKNVHLSVLPPDGRVRISAPTRMRLDTIRVFAISKLPWIRTQQEKILQQERETAREYVDRESHYVWGRRYLLKVVEHSGVPKAQLKPRQLLLFVAPHTRTQSRSAIVSRWYREQVRAALPDLLEKWGKRIGVRVERVLIQKMKTKWGSCNPRTGIVRLNTDLAKKPPECLEYILAHELLHLREPHHSRAFQSQMDKLLPNWRTLRQILNEAPLTHENWDY